MLIEAATGAEMRPHSVDKTYMHEMTRKKPRAYRWRAMSALRVNSRAALTHLERAMAL